MKKYFTVFFFLMAIGSQFAKAQAPDWLWAVQSINNISGAGDRWFAVPSQMCHDAQGNIYVLGGANRNLSVEGGSLKVDSNSFGSLFLVKYNPDGKALWVRQIFDSSEQSLASFSFGATFSDFLSSTCSISMDSIGHCFVCGTSVKTVDLGNKNSLGIGPYIVSYDTAGNVLWAKNIGKMIGSSSARYFTISAMVADRYGSIYITGSFFDSLSFQNVLLVGNWYRSIFIAKFDNTGNISWAKDAGGRKNNADYGIGICIDNSGENSEVYVMGSLSGDTAFFDNKFVVDQPNTTQIFLAKYDGQGAALWVRSSDDQPGTSCSGHASAVSSDPQGNAYLCGNFQADSGFFGDPHIHAIEARNSYYDPYHAFIVKFNPMGTTQWVKQITSYNVNDSSTVHASNVLVDDKFNVYVSLANNGTTNFNGIEGGLSNLNDVTNLCVLECDNNGKSNWLQSSTAESIAGGIDKYIYSTELFCNGHLYVCGAYNSSMIFGSTHLITNDPSQHTMYLAKLGNTPSSVTTRATMSQNTFAFYPNPAASQATIIYTLTKPGNVTLEIYDLLGRKVKYIPHGELSIGEHSEMLDLHELGNGTYLCRMISGGTVSSDVFTLVK